MGHVPVGSVAVAKGKHIAWHEPAKLEQITNWAANGCTDEQIAQNIGIRRQTIYDWMNKYPDISDAIKKGREMSIACIENAFFKRAMGGEVVIEEIEEFKGTFKDGKPQDGTGTKRTVKKHLPGDVAAQIFYLKNKAGYKDKPEVEMNVAVVPTFTYERK